MNSTVPAPIVAPDATVAPPREAPAAEWAGCTRWEPDTVADDASRGRIGVSTLRLSGMHCAACAGIIEDALRSQPGVLDVRVSAPAERAAVRWREREGSPEGMIDAVRRAGYAAAPDVPLHARELRRRESRTTLWRLFVAGFCAMQVMMLATPSYVAGPGELAPDLRQLLNWGSWVLSIPVLWFAGMPFLRGAWRALRGGRIGMDVPVALGIVVTFVASTLSTFDPAGPLGHETYFDSMTMFLAFLWLGRWLEMRARHRAASALESSLGALPEGALRVRGDGLVEQVDLNSINPGDVIRVPSGAAVPADGVLLTAHAGVAEALLTGESIPRAKRAGDTLLAGSINSAAPLEMRAERVGADTRFEAIAALTREALAARPAGAALADRWAGPFLWGVLLVAATAGAAWSVIDPARALPVVAAVLVVTCPCALWLATPATLVAAAGGLARRGVLLRRVGALETLARAERVFIDKTGTLTEDRPQLEGVQVRPAAGWLGADEALARAAALAQWSTHPLSAALAAHARGAVEAWHDVDEHPGLGLSARDGGGRRWQLGSAPWVGAPGSDAGAVWLACDGVPVAAFRFRESAREGAAAAVRQLRALGLAPTLLSGDDADRAHALAAEVHIDDVVAPASPEAKLAAVHGAQRNGATVAMVGDGLNDAPVLAAADVSLAMGHGALAAREGADAVIVSGRPASVVDAVATARRTLAIVRQNLVWSVGYNAACIPLAVAGWLPPWAAGLGMAASSLLVIVNAQRAAHG
jgi:Cu2+-exporting ATPase